MQVSDSENENEAREGFAPLPAMPAQAAPQVLSQVAEDLKRSFIFKGIPEELLMETVARMRRVTFKSGETILQQGAVPTAEDCMYLVEEGRAEVVIMGTVDTSQKKRSSEWGQKEGVGGDGRTGPEGEERAGDGEYVTGGEQQ